VVQAHAFDRDATKQCNAEEKGQEREAQAEERGIHPLLQLSACDFSVQACVAPQEPVSKLYTDREGRGVRAECKRGDGLGAM